MISAPLVQRINGRHGAHIVDYAAKIGLGSLAYDLFDITNAVAIEDVVTEGVKKYNVYDVNVVKVLFNEESIDTLSPGLYIVNGVKTLVGRK